MIRLVDAYDVEYAVGLSYEKESGRALKRNGVVVDQEEGIKEVKERMNMWNGSAGDQMLREVRALS